MGDSLPLIDVDLRPVQDAKRKKDLLDGISEVFKNTLSISKKDIFCFDNGNYWETDWSLKCYLISLMHFVYDIVINHIPEKISA